MSPFQMIAAQSFAISIILEFLELNEILRILIIVNKRRLKFVPSPGLLDEILQQAIRFSSAAERQEGEYHTFPSSTQDRETKPTLLIISEDKTLTLHTMRNLYDFIKMSIKSECEPCCWINSITVIDKTCTFWNYGNHVERLSFKVIFSSSAQCSDQNCNGIVLWHCDVCKNPCSECLAHVTLCEICDKGTCKDCIVAEDLCKNCSFFCSNCDDLIPHAPYGSYVCEGPDDGPCPYSLPYCNNCDHLPGIESCSKCIDITDKYICMCIYSKTNYHLQYLHHC
jgi:hypothetical protein